MGMARLSKLAALSKKERPSAVTILLIALISVGIILIKTQKNGSELFFLFAPLAAITSNYIESGTSKNRRVFNELFLWSILLLVLVLPWLE
jgi:drug/metabolite transporter (DMT)-like permease